MPENNRYEAKGRALREQPWADTRVLACGHTDWDHAIGGDCEAILEGR
jgi:hypothetical protein